MLIFLVYNIEDIVQKFIQKYYKLGMTIEIIYAQKLFVK